MNAGTTFLLVRHAMTDEAGSIFSGRRSGVSLNQTGREQALAVADKLAPWSVAAIYSSPRTRAVQTAEAIGSATGKTPVTDVAFDELDCGDWTGRPFSELQSDTAFHNFNTFRSAARPPGGESVLQLMARMVAGLEKCCVRHPGGTVAVVSHAEPIRSVIAYFAGSPLDLMLRFEISPASVSGVRISSSEATLLFVNQTV
jgi:broad specificity phosphatase PhoE